MSRRRKREVRKRHIHAGWIWRKKREKGKAN
jgi:hypothetical protein